MKKFILFFIFTLSLFSLSVEASATSCLIPSCESKFQQHELVFKGKALKTKKSFSLPFLSNKQDTYTEFQVLSLYKGTANNKVKIYYSTRKSQHYRTPEAFKRGDEVLIFADKKDNHYLTYRGPCSGCKYQGIDFEAIKASKDALDALIEKHPTILESVPKHYK